VVSKAKRQIVNIYCQRDSNRLMFAIFSEENIEVYRGNNIKDTDLAANLLIPYTADCLIVFFISTSNLQGY
jgi:hypothetical protein